MDTREVQINSATYTKVTDSAEFIFQNTSSKVVKAVATTADSQPLPDIKGAMLIESLLGFDNDLVGGIIWVKTLNGSALVSVTD